MGQSQSPRPRRRAATVQVDRGVRGFVVIAAGASTAAFSIAFELGAFGAVFFDHLHAIWVLSTVALLSSFVLGDRLTLPRWGRLVLAIPTVWLLVAFVDARRSEALVDVMVSVAMVATIMSLPYLAYTLIAIISPGFLTLPGRRLQAGAVAVTVFIAGVGFTLGRVNDQFLTCGDFKVSGNDQPANCRKGAPTTQWFTPG